MSEHALLPGSGKREASDDVDSADALERKKKKAANASSRGVANLTPEQLAKKRQNDREAQRAIRERTKNQIDALERRIQDLTSQQPYQELQHVLRQKEAVEAENADIKKRLASVMSMLEPLLGNTSHSSNTNNIHHNNTYTSPSQPNFAPPRPSSAATSTMAMASHSNISSPAATSPNAQWHVPMDSVAQIDARGTTLDRELQQQRYNFAHSLDIGHERLGLGFLVDKNRHNHKRMSGSLNGIHGQHDEVIPTGPAPPPNYVKEEIPAHSTLPKNGPPTCLLDSILLDFLHSRQQQAAEGVDMPKLVGPAYPSVSSLLNPALSVNSHPLSKVFTDILGTFPIHNLPEQVAVLYLMFLTMRWQIAPTQEHYNKLPEWMVPRPSQLFQTHPAWIDHLPFPRMRDKLAREYNPQEYLFENFTLPFTSTMSLNWPYPPEDVLVSVSFIGGEEYRINPNFESHLRKLENWTLGPAFLKAMPGLEDTFNMKDDDGIRKYSRN